jgi:predicted acylesterase/phospholipase RssA/CRP-like cAMP-binding protein
VHSSGPSHSFALLQSSTVLGRLLQGYPLFRGVGEDEIQRVVQIGRVVSRPRGEVLAREGQVLEQLFVLLRGRVEIAAVLPKGTVRPLGEIGPGEPYGELGLLTGDKLSTRATASTDVVLLELERAQFEALFRRIPAFGENLFRRLGQRMSATHASRPRRPERGVLGIGGPSARAPELLRALGWGLASRGAAFAVLASEGASAVGIDGGSIETLSPGDSASADGVVRRIAELRAARDIVLLLFEPGLEARHTDPRLVPCEELWWVVDPACAAAGLPVLADLLARRKTLQGRTRLIWALREGERPLLDPRPPNLLSPEFRVFLPASGAPSSRREKASIRRVVGDLEGLRVGLALGGGGSRGFAHCGVLKVLEEEGIAVDRIAGTSMGALVGLTYAAGTPPDQIVEEIAREARVPLALRFVPQGRYLSFWLKARTGAFERSIRETYGRIRFEELDFPLQTVTADLIRGEPVVRESGDCVDAVIESINLPVFSRPILRDGRALVDGGILNNLPTDLLLAHEIEAVIGVDVLSSGADAAGNGDPRRPGMLEALLRVAEIQHERLTALGAGQADLLLRVDAGRFAMTDFSPENARRIAELGDAAARAAVESLRELVPARWRSQA